MISQINSDIGKEALGYVINSSLSKVSQDVVSQIQNQLKENFSDLFWFPPTEALHVTLLDLIAPLVSYLQGKDFIFEENKRKYVTLFEGLTKDQTSIRINFDQILVSSSAIYITGTDDGSYQNIRSAFIDKVELEPGTKMPPSIIHVSIARFIKEVDLENIKEFVSELNINFNEIVTEFRLVKETKIPMLDYSVLQKFSLKQS